MVTRQLAVLEKIQYSFNKGTFFLKEINTIFSIKANVNVYRTSKIFKKKI
jgi:hypothetical protein